jgi:hypothetical protein
VTARPAGTATFNGVVGLVADLEIIGPPEEAVTVGGGILVEARSGLGHVFGGDELFAAPLALVEH